jgi:hypothetical protein
MTSLREDGRKNRMKNKKKLETAKNQIKILKQQIARRKNA